MYLKSLRIPCAHRQYRKSVGIANSALTVHFAASTTVGSMAPVAAPSHRKPSKRRKRPRYRSSSSSSDNCDSAPRNTNFAASTEGGHGSRRDRPRSHLNMDMPQFCDLLVNVSTNHGNERQEIDPEAKAQTCQK